MKILIIDDEIYTVTTVKAFLAELTADVDAAYSGHEGIKKMRANPDYDLLILDFMMSGMSGLDVCQEMTGDNKIKKIPVLLISALPVTSPELHELLEEFNQTHMIKGVLEKPFGKNALLEEVKKILKIEQSG
ncbi:MAG TPA: response regulator [Candidatus Nanoarchaeia archaeon]|nr:response regulator [Candidatus Nanoarchaeia archaeon]